MRTPITLVPRLSIATFAFALLACGARGGESSQEVSALSDTDPAAIPWEYPAPVVATARDTPIAVDAVCRYELLRVTSPNIPIRIGPSDKFVPFNEHFCGESVVANALPEDTWNAGKPFHRRGEARLSDAGGGKLTITLTFDEFAQPLGTRGVTIAPTVRALTAAQGASVTLGLDAQERHREYGPSHFQITADRETASYWFETMSMGLWYGSELKVEHSGTYYVLRSPRSPCPGQAYRLACRASLAP